MATPTDICNMAISRLGQPKINDIGENSAAAIACRDHFEPVRDALLRGHPWNFATVRADLAEGATPEYGWSRSFTLPDDFLRLNTVNGVEASRCEADYSLTFRTIYSNADTLQVTYVKQIEDTTLFDPLFVEAFVLKLAAAIAPSIADPTEKSAMEGLSASRLRDAAFADASENRSMISTTSMGAASRYYRPQAVAFDAWGPSVGIKGGDGWTPLISLVNDAGREVVYVYDWTGGDGIAPKPGIGYVGRYGIVSNIADAVSIRGTNGPNSVTTSTTTNISGLLKGNGNVVSAATAGTDYAAAEHTHDGDTLGFVEKIQFDTTPTGVATTVGDLIWNVEEETLDLQLDGFLMHIGQHLIYHAQNQSGSPIAKGTPVMFDGTDGGSGKLLIKPWDGTGPATLFMGITGETFANGHQGSVVAFGKLRDIQTNGANYSQTWANGEIIYAGTNAVKLTNTKPSAPNPIVEVMAVIRSHANAGIVFVRPNYFTADVFGPSSATDNAIARFDGTTGKLIQTGGITIADGATGTLAGSNSGDVTLTGTPNYLTIANQVITRNNVNLGSHVTGTLPVANGGTGQTSLGAINAADFGSGAAADNYVLTADGAGGAAWEVSGAPITGTGLAYVRTGGDNSTAVIGNPSKPYSTGQAAWNANATSFDFGPGSFSIDAAFGSGGYSLPIYVQGAGISASTLTFTWRGEDGVEQNGFTAPDLNLSSDKSVYLIVAIEGGDGTSAVSDPYNGGNVANHYFSNCYISTLSLTQGAGCNGGTSGTQATSSGAEFTTIVTGALQGSTIYKNAILEAGVFSPDKLTDGNKGNITVSASGTAWSVNQNSLQLDTLVAATAKGKIIGRKTAGAGNFEECDISDFITITPPAATTSNITDNTNTVSNITGMSFSIAANEKVTAIFKGFWATNTSGSGFKYAFTGPSSPTAVQIGDFCLTSATAGRTESGMTAFGTVATQGGGTLLNSAMPIMIQIFVNNGSTPGTVQLQMSGEVNGSTFTLYKGFTMQVLRIP
jgi:hypothetical protein